MKSYFTIFWDITPCSLWQQVAKALLATCFHAGFFLGLFFDPEDGGDMFLRNVGSLTRRDIPQDRTLCNTELLNLCTSSRGLKRNILTTFYDKPRKQL
jgi:hypothetical protein